MPFSTIISRRLYNSGLRTAWRTAWATQHNASRHQRCVASTVASSAEQPTSIDEMAPESFKVVKEDVLFSRYMTLYDRRVRFNTASGEQELDYDVIGHPSAEFKYAMTFPFHPYKDGTKGGEVTLVREYGQGPNDLVYCLPTGAYDTRKHETIEDCAKAELSEEANLSGGRWVRLTPDDHPGFIEVKWCINRGHPFLVIDPRDDSSPGERDFEEFNLQVLRVTIPELRQLMAGGNMLGPSINTCYMAMEWLQKEGLL